MTTEQKAQVIGDIISNLRFAASQNKKPFDEGDTFFSLCFMEDGELMKIAKLACGI